LLSAAADYFFFFFAADFFFTTFFFALAMLGFVFDHHRLTRRRVGPKPLLLPDVKPPSCAPRVGLGGDVIIRMCTGGVELFQRLFSAAKMAAQTCRKCRDGEDRIQRIPDLGSEI
jgi:hypothetical protein